MMASCALCHGVCAEADLDPLLDSRLAWLWQQIGRAADRRGDAALVTGSLSVRAPAAAEERAAAAGLLGDRVLRQGQTRNVDLEELTRKLRVRGSQLTPGAVAAHALGRRLAVRAAAHEQRRSQEHMLKTAFLTAVQSLGDMVFRERDSIWATLRRSGWLARLVALPDPERQLRLAISVVAMLPPAGTRTERRRLAADATGNPHALDHGSPLSSLVMALLAAAGGIEPGQRPARAWGSLGVDSDDVVGGLIAIGIVPVGWQVPPGAVITLPPRVLSTCEWPSPDAADSWVFVTENPSVTSAAADIAASAPQIRLLCTSGTPSATEIAALARLAASGWPVAVRADFDQAGIGHVIAILQAVPRAVPWRMSAQDYTNSLQHMIIEGGALDGTPETPWDPELRTLMQTRGAVAYEEALLPLLLDDLRRGHFL
jgi:uncharacterized protein (TIGR02679 family)